MGVLFRCTKCLLKMLLCFLLADASIQIPLCALVCQGDVLAKTTHCSDLIYGLSAPGVEMGQLFLFLSE